MLLSFLCLGMGCGDEDEPPSPPEPAPREEPPQLPPATAGGLARLADWFARRPALTFLLAGGQGGKLKPCGCSKPQLGGLRRLAAFLDILLARAKAGRGVVTPLSLGWSLKGSGEEQEEAKADYLRAAYEELGFQGILLGDSDLGVAAMCQPRGGEGPAGEGVQAPRPPLNVGLSPSNPAVDTLPMLELVVRTVGVRACSLVDASRAEALRDAGLLDDRFTSANGALGGLSPRPDGLMIVAMRPGDEAAIAAVQGELARIGPAVIVLVGDSALGEAPVDRVPLGVGRGAPVVRLPEMGKAAGVLDLEEDKENGGWLASWRAVELDPDLENRESPLAQQIDALDALYRRVVREQGYLQRFPRHPDPGPRYVGTSACVKCHRDVYLDWRQTPHGRALATLREIDYDADPECIRCHVVGWRRTPEGSYYVVESAFRDAETTAFLGDVGCENCHGPGESHVAEPWNAALFASGGPNHRPAGTHDCQRCHDSENSVDFLAKEAWYLEQVSHTRVPSDRRTVVPK